MVPHQFQLLASLMAHTNPASATTVAAAVAPIAGPGSPTSPISPAADAKANLAKPAGLLVGSRVHIIRPPHNSRRMSVAENTTVTREGNSANGGWYAIQLERSPGETVFFRRGSLELVSEHSQYNAQKQEQHQLQVQIAALQQQQHAQLVLEGQQRQLAFALQQQQQQQHLAQQQLQQQFAQQQFVQALASASSNPMNQLKDMLMQQQLHKLQQQHQLPEDKQLMMALQERLQQQQFQQQLEQLVHAQQSQARHQQLLVQPSGVHIGQPNLSLMEQLFVQQQQQRIAQSLGQPPSALAALASTGVLSLAQVAASANSPPLSGMQHPLLAQRLVMTQMVAAEAAGVDAVMANGRNIKRPAESAPADDDGADERSSKRSTAGHQQLMHVPQRNEVGGTDATCDTKVMATVAANLLKQPSATNQLGSASTSVITETAVAAPTPRVAFGNHMSVARMDDCAKPNALFSVGVQH